MSDLSLKQEVTGLIDKPDRVGSEVVAQPPPPARLLYGWVRELGLCFNGPERGGWLCPGAVCACVVIGKPVRPSPVCAYVGQPLCKCGTGLCVHAPMQVHVCVYTGQEGREEDGCQTGEEALPRRGSRGSFSAGITRTLCPGYTVASAAAFAAVISADNSCRCASRGEGARRVGALGRP